MSPVVTSQGSRHLPRDGDPPFLSWTTWLADVPGTRVPEARRRPGAVLRGRICPRLGTANCREPDKKAATGEVVPLCQNPGPGAGSVSAPRDARRGSNRLLPST